MAEEAQHETPSKDAQKAMAYLPSFVRRVSAHQFLLAELPPDLRDALADYDVDGDGARPRVSQPSRDGTPRNSGPAEAACLLFQRAECCSSPCAQARSQLARLRRALTSCAGRRKRHVA